MGAGSIGVSFAATFADAGGKVALVEPLENRREAVEEELAKQRRTIAAAGLELGGNGRVSVSGELGDALQGVDLVLECGPEDLEIKRRIFSELIANAGQETVLATASSALTISTIVPNEAAQARCVVAHPVNPPSVLRLIEIVPAPGTSANAITAAQTLFRSAGFQPVQLGREIEGFVLNRLQGAVLREAYRLVDEGVTNVAGVDTVMQLGLGPRWALSGPFETADLNTPGGITAHAKRMGPAYAQMGLQRGETVNWSDALVQRVADERRTQVPEDRLKHRVDWRARSVAKLVALRDRLAKGADG